MITPNSRIIDLTVKELQDILNEAVDQRISQIQPQQPQQDEELLTIKEAAKFLKISVVSIHKWKKAGKITFIRFGTRIRFKKSELLKATEGKRSRR